MRDIKRILEKEVPEDETLRLYIELTGEDIYFHLTGNHNQAVSAIMNIVMQNDDFARVIKDAMYNVEKYKNEN